VCVCVYVCVCVWLCIGPAETQELRDIVFVCTYETLNTCMIGAADTRNHQLRITGAPSETQELGDFA
jgi:hypothetical protein